MYKKENLVDLTVANYENLFCSNNIQNDNFLEKQSTLFDDLYFNSAAACQTQEFAANAISAFVCQAWANLYHVIAVSLRD